jgi:hypothetical protein
MKSTVLTVLSLVVVSASHAAVLTVTNTNDSGPGCLRWCIEQAQPGDEIQFDPNLDGQPIVLNRSLAVNETLTITGRASQNTIVEGAPRHSVFSISGAGANVTISGLTIRNGEIGISVGWGASLNISHSAISGNHTTRYWGGGIRSDGTLTVSNCVISGNSAYHGGGIMTFGDSTLIDSTITGNWTDRTGGGIYQGWGTLTVSGTTVTGNSAGAGGAILLYHGDLIVSDSTISGNSASGYTGGIFLGEGTFSAINSTISGNSAGWPWGVGVYNGYDHTSLTARNTIIANQVNGTDCAHDPPNSNFLSLGHNLDSDGTCNFDHPSDQPDTNPMLGPLQDNYGPTWTHVPLAGSPVIDRGWCDPGSDQRGVPRPLDGNRDNVWICDIGAVEYVPYKFEVVGPSGDVIVLPPDSE